jgi:hypothetical protein
MSDLFAWFQNYLNLSKLTAVSVPGMIVAFALILVLGPIPCPQNTKSCPFCSANLKPPSISTANITAYSVSGTTVTISAENDFAKGDQVIITGATTRPELNRTWQIDSAGPTSFALVAITDNDKQATTATNGTITSKIAAYSISNNEVTVTVANGFAKEDEVTIAGSTVQSQLNGKWKLDTVNPTTLTMTTPKLKAGNGTESGTVSNGTFEAKVKQYSTAANGTTTITIDDSFAPGENVTVANAKSQPQLNGKWQIDTSNATGFTIKAPMLTAGKGQETGTAVLVSSGSARTTKDTVIVSGQNWLTPGSDGEAVVPRLQSFPNAIPQPAIDKIQTSCANLPLYIVANSRPAPSNKDKNAGSSSQSGSSDSDASKSKQGTPQYADEQAVPYQPLWAGSNACYANLAALDGWLQARIAERQSLTTQETSDLSALSTSLASAQASGERLVERDLAGKVQQKKDDLKSDQTASKWLTQAEAYVASLETQVKTMQSQLQAQMTTAATTPTASTAGAVFLTIQQNIIMFLLFSLIIGQILDPIQRGLVSFSSPRRSAFETFNRVYGRKGDGEMRFGDRRLPPWTVVGTYAPKTSASLPIRRSSADIEYLKNMNVYDENYAIGAGFITQNEYKTIHDEYYGQSQITSGLILPVAVFSLCLGIRFICCSSASSDVAHATWLIVTILLTMYAGIVFGAFIAFVMSYFTSSEYGRIFKEFLSGYKDRESIFDIRRILILVCSLSLIVFFLVDLAYTEIPTNNLLIVMTPCLLICPLWIGGLDRLHKYYSEIQSRIAGNILKLQTTTQQKILDLIADPNAAAALKKKAKDAKEGQTQLLAFLESIATADPSPAQPTPPGGSSDTQVNG